jgi:putative membrane protein
MMFLLAMMAWGQTPSMGAGPGAATASGSNTSSGAKMTSSDRQFITKAAEGGKAEVELGQLAAQKGQSQEVKDFGRRMVSDHTKANEHLQQVAQQEGITLPDRIDPESQALKKKLEGLSGAEFDRVYMSNMVKDHTKDIQEFKEEASKGQDPAVKNFAQQTLPTLEEHLKLAKQINTKENQRASK